MLSQKLINHFIRSKAFKLLRPFPWAVAIVCFPWITSIAKAEIQATGAEDLGTTINGVKGGSCVSGTCQISGGKDIGNNRFHRFSTFNTLGPINEVKFDTAGQSNLIIGVTSTSGSYIDKTINLSLSSKPM